ncbi:Ww domain, partial [Globisporangium splendens]
MPMDSYPRSGDERRHKNATEPVGKNRSASVQSSVSTASTSSNQSSKSAFKSSSSSSKSSSSSSKRSRARFSVPEDAEGLSRFASLSGFLRKQADNEEGAWNKYYFCVRPATYLYYYNTPTDDRPRGIIDMEFLKDIRWNVDCLQRCVGGSENCFRVTGQMAKGTHNGGDSDKARLRPLFLDPETREEAQQWMEAFENHRFNAEHANGYYSMRKKIREAEDTLAQLTEDAQRAATIANTIRQKGRTLLSTLRGIEADPSISTVDELARGSFDVDANHDDLFSTLEAIELLVEDFSAEAAQQAKVIETLRQREAQQEKKLREVTKFVAPVRKLEPVVDAQQQAVAMDTSNIIDSDEFSRMERAGMAKGRSTSDVRELFKKTTGFLSGKKAAENSTTANTTNAVAAMSPKVLEPCREEDEESGDETAAAAPAKKAGFVNALKKRVTKTTTTSSTATTPVPAQAPSSPKSPQSSPRRSDDTISISTDRGSADSMGVVETEKLPDGWSKRESRTHPGDFYYVHTASGYTTWEVPTEAMMAYIGIDEDDNDSGSTSSSKYRKMTVTASQEVFEKSDFYADQPMGSLAAVAQAVVQAEEDAAESDDGSKPAAKKSKGWGFLKKFPKKALGKATTGSPKDATASPVIAVEHEDGRHEF